MGTVSAIKNEFGIQFFFFLSPKWIIFNPYLLDWFFIILGFSPNVGNNGLSNYNRIYQFYADFFKNWRGIGYDTFQMHMPFLWFFDDWFLFQVMHFVINWIKLLNQERQIQELITDLEIYLKTINLVCMIPFQK